MQANHAVQPDPTYILYTEYYRHFEVIRAETMSLRNEVHKLRYQVYCVENPFENPDENPRGLEIDLYDTHSIHYLLIHRRSSMPVGTVRMVMPIKGETARSFPIQNVCDLEGLATPQQVRKAAEISRFCISREMRKRVTDVSMYSEPHIPDAEDANNMHRIIHHASLGLIHGVGEVMLEHGIETSYLLCEPVLRRILGRLGVCSDPVGPQVEYHGLRVPVTVTMTDVFNNLWENHRDIWEIITDRGRLDRTPRVA